MEWHPIGEILLQEKPFIFFYSEIMTLDKFAGHIAIDRQGGAATLRAMTIAARNALAQQRPVVIFPQGTRVAPGARGAGVPYQPGVAALYSALNVPILPVALNSGLFWQRSPFSKKPGCITVQFLPPVPPP